MHVQASSEKNKTGGRASSPSLLHSEVLSSYPPSNDTSTGIHIARGGGEGEGGVDPPVSSSQGIDERSSKERDTWMKAMVSEALRSRASSIRVKLPLPAKTSLLSPSSHVEEHGIGGTAEEEEDEGDILVEENDDDERREVYYRQEASRQIFTGNDKHTGIMMLPFRDRDSLSMYYL